jgi:hypothetical protein
VLKWALGGKKEFFLSNTVLSICPRVYLILNFIDHIKVLSDNVKSYDKLMCLLVI